MVSDELAKQLHDRATRGEPLSAQERAQLENWYALQDSAESNTLGLAATEKTLSTLQTQVDSALAQLTTVTKRMQEIASENEALRREVADLRRQLAQPPTPQLA
jgi:peptidoglycan hydrolase CwlO-like protein